LICPRLADFNFELFVRTSCVDDIIVMLGAGGRWQFSDNLCGNWCRCVVISDAKNADDDGNSQDKLRHPRSDAYSAQQVLLNRQQICRVLFSVNIHSN